MMASSGPAMATAILPSPDPWKSGHLLKIAQVHVVADVALGGVIRRGEIPRGLHAGAERPADHEPPLLAVADLTVQRLEVPAGRDRPPELLDQPACRRLAGHADRRAPVRRSGAA